MIIKTSRDCLLRQAIPNPLGLLSTVQSKNLLKTAISVLYMTVDSALSYLSATSQAELQFIQNGWEKKCDGITIPLICFRFHGNH